MATALNVFEKSSFVCYKSQIYYMKKASQINPKAEDWQQNEAHCILFGRRSLGKMKQ